MMNEKVSKILNHPATVPICVGVGAFAAGYILGKKRAETYVIPPMTNHLPDNVIDTSGEFLSTEAERFIESKLRPFVEDVDESEVAGTLDPNQMALEIVPEFAGNDDDWDYEVETEHRSEDAPYILHKDEFYQDELGFTQLSLTYYAGDDILSDEDDTPIYNHAQIIGTIRFGHGSGDPNVFYVRNHKLKAEYEILHDPGMFSVEVMGLDIPNNVRTRDLKHSGVRRFREE